MADGDNESDATQIYLLGKTYLANNQGQFYIRNDPIINMAVGDRHTIIVTQNGRAFAFGDNSSGQLGLGHKNQVEKVSCIKSLKFSTDEKVIMAACGRESSLVATNFGALYAFGSNSSYQLGIDDEDDQPTPKLIERLKGSKFKQLAMGAEHACALTTEGAVYIWGSNEETQCGQLAKVKVVKEPRELRVDFIIDSISCGYYHTAFVTEEGKLLVCGSNETRQLGRKMPPENASPAVVSLPGRVKDVACGHNHTVVLTENGEVYTCGFNDRGQLGLTDRVQTAETFELVPELPKQIKAIAAGEGHTAVIGPRQDLYVFGDGKHGKLGSTTHSNEFQACRVERFKHYHVLNVVCGGCQTIVLAKKTSANEEDTGNATLSVTQRPKSQARVNRNKSIADRSAHVGDSMDSTLRPVRPLGAGNHLRVEPDPGSDSERSTKELSESLKSATFNQTHTISNGRFRPTQSPSMNRTQTQRGMDDDLKPLRTGALDRTVKLTPDVKKSRGSDREKSSSNEDENDDRRKKPSPVPPRRDVQRKSPEPVSRRKNSDDDDDDKSPPLNRFSRGAKPVPPRRHSPDDEEEEEEEKNDRFKKSRDPPASNRQNKVPPVAATRGKSSDDDDDDDDDDDEEEEEEEEEDRSKKRKDPPASSRQSKAPPPTRTRRGSLPSSNNNNSPSTRDGNQTIGSRPVNGLRSSIRTPASKSLAKPAEPPKKEPEPAPTQQPGFFARLFGAKPATPPAAAPQPATNATTTASTAQPATNTNSKTCSVM